MEYETSRAVARCGIPPGCSSRVFTVAEFADALLSTERQHTVYVERDASGHLSGCGGAGAELAAACARLAPHPPARTATLQMAGTGGSAGAGGALRLNCTRALAPHDELLLWPDDSLLAMAAVPVLTPLHIRGGADYRCDICGAHYDQPNPLKMHLYLGCAAPSPIAFWRRVLAHLTTPVVQAAPPAAPPPSPAALEALAAAWGAWHARGGGHACVYCGKLYSRKYGLKIHIRTHTGYKPLRCGHCARRFGDPSNLNKHVRLHAASGEGSKMSRYACAHCGAVLARRRDLERHVRARHAAPAPAPTRAPAPLAAHSPALTAG